jgi:3,5-epimerase/4-reductase
MKLLIYGSAGWIGKQFIDVLTHMNISYVMGTSRVDNTSAVENEIKSVSPSHVISFIGRTHGDIDGKKYSTIDYLEQPGKLKDNLRDNLFSPLSLAILCNSQNIHYTYLGTGCIFTYDDNHPFGKEESGFLENSLPNFFGSGYSTAKGFTDRLMTLIGGNTLNLRIRMPITNEDNPRNFITKITTYKKICSIPNSMSVLPELLPLVVKMMKRGTTGTMNLTNPGLISHNEILEMYRDHVDPHFTWENFSLEEQAKILASERSNNFLDTSRLEKMFPQIKPIKESVREMLENYKINKCVTENCDTSVSLLQLGTDFENTKDTTLLVTGGCGFIGSNFINLIMEKFDKIKLVNFDAMYYCASETNVDELWRTASRYTFVKGNLCSMDLVRHVFDTHQPTHVIHFAAQSHVQNSFSDALQYTQDNVVGTHTLLEVTRLYGKIKKFIHVSTDEVYGESMLDVGETHKTEQSVLCPTNPYAATKAGAELMAQSYNHSFGMPIVITRGNNVFGPNQYPEKVIPRFIQQLKAGEKVTIQGDGSCVRAFLHSYDTARAFQTILERGKIGEIYNIGCDEGMEYSIMDVAKMLIEKICGTTDYDKWITYIEDRPFNDQRYYISNQKLKDLGWDIRVSFLEGINMLV